MAPYLNTVGSFDPLSTFVTSMWFIQDIWMWESHPMHPSSYRKYYNTINVRIYINVQTKILAIEKYDNWVTRMHTIWCKNVKHLMDSILIYDRLFSELQNSKWWPLPF